MKFEVVLRLYFGFDVFYLVKETKNILIRVFFFLEDVDFGCVGLLDLIYIFWLGIIKFLKFMI